MIGVMGTYFLALEPFHEFLQIDDISLMVSPSASSSCICILYDILENG